VGTLKPTWQGIISFQIGRQSADALTENFRNLVVQKAGDNIRTTVAVVRQDRSGTANATEMIMNLNAARERGEITRLYLNGHGDGSSQTVSGWTGREVAKILGHVAVDRLRIWACCAAAPMFGDPKDAAEARLAHSVDSFAGKLCGAMKNRGLEVHANYYIETVDQYSVRGTRTQSGMGKPVWGRPESIVIFRWTGVAVERQWKSTGKYATHMVTLPNSADFL